MPGLPVGVPGAGQRLGQGPVRAPPVLARRGLVDRRPHQRVAHRERRRVADEQPGVQGGLQRRLLQAQAGRRAAQHVELAGVVGGREQQDGLHRRRQPPAPVEEDLLDVGGEVELRRQGLGASELGRGELAGQLQQGQRVAARLRDEPLGHLLGRCVAQMYVEEGAGRVRLEAGQDQSRGGPAGRRSPRRRPGRRTPWRPGPPRAGGRRTGALPPWPGPASARRRRHTAPGSPRPPRSAATRSPRPPGTAPPKVRRPRRTPPAAPGPEDREAPPAAVSAGAAVDGAPRTPAAPRPRVPGCAAPSPPRPGPRARRAAPTCPRPARHARPALPAVPCRACSTSAPRRARSGSRPTSTRRRYTLADHRSRSNPGALTGATAAARSEASDPCRPALAPAGADPTTTTPGGTAMQDPTPTGPTVDDPGPRAGQRRHIGLLLFDGVEELDAVGPWEVLSHWTQQHPEDGWDAFCLSADGAPVVGAKTLVLGAHHSIARRPGTRRTHPPGRPGHQADAARPGPPGLGPASSGPRSR